MIDQMFTDISNELKATAAMIDNLVAKHDITCDEFEAIILRSDNCCLSLARLYNSFEGVIVTGFLPVNGDIKNVEQ